MRAALAVLTALLAAATPTPSPTSKPSKGAPAVSGGPVVIGPVERPVGCGCEIVVAGKNVFTDLDGETVTMNLDGKMTELRKVSEDDNPGKVGATFRSRFRAGGVEMVIIWTVKDVCPADSESCEYQGRSAVIEVTRKGVKTRAEGTGGCGC